MNKKIVATAQKFNLTYPAMKKLLLGIQFSIKKYH